MSYNPDVLHTEDFAREAECYGTLERQLHLVVGLLNLSERLAWGLKGFVFGSELEKAGNEWVGVGNWLGTDWSENGPWDKKLHERCQALKAKGITRATCQRLMQPVFDELFLAMDALDHAATEYFLASEKRYLATDRAEEWADDFDHVRAKLARARKYAEAYRGQWLAFHEKEEAKNGAKEGKDGN